VLIDLDANQGTEGPTRRFGIVGGDGAMQRKASFQLKLLALPEMASM
jgi:hypothetical protein